MKRVTKDITCCAGCPAMTHSTTFGIWYCSHSATAEATPDLRERKATLKGFRDDCPLPDVGGRPEEQGATHLLKTWPEYFQAIKSGAKTFEIRRNDRGYAVGDTLVLHEWDQDARSFGGELRVQVTYMTNWEQREGYVVMGIRHP